MLSGSLSAGEAALASKRSESSATRAELNRQIRTAVRRFDLSDRTEDTWAFLCECGADGCQEWVTMPLAGYEALHRSGEPILARGHTITRGEKARRNAKRLADDAHAEAEGQRQ
jgi:hypothetical protein